jgi:hypothetical protein
VKGCAVLVLVVVFLIELPSWATSEIPPFGLRILAPKRRLDFALRCMLINKQLRDSSRYLQARMFDQAIQQLRDAESKVFRLALSSGIFVRSPLRIRLELWKAQLLKAIATWWSDYQAAKGLIQFHCGMNKASPDWSSAFLC